MEPQKRKLLGPIEIFCLIVGLGVLAYVGYKGGGGSIAKRTETVTIHDKPREVRSEPTRFKKGAPDAKVESMLHNLAEHFSDKSQRQRQSAKQVAQLPRDEAKFYEKVRREESLSDKVKSTADWLRVLRTSQKTYSKVRSVLSESVKKPADKINHNNVNQMLENESSADAFYRKLSDQFDISKDDLQDFGSQGKNALSDWATYILEKKKKD